MTSSDIIGRVRAPLLPNNAAGAVDVICGLEKS